MSNAYRSTLAGGGSAVGDATAADVLTGKTFSGAVGSGVSGTMPNNGADTQTIAPGSSYTIPAGYHNGSGVISASAADYTPKYVQSFAPFVSTAQAITGLSVGKHQMFISGTLVNVTAPTAPAVDTISGATLEFKEYVNDSGNSQTVIRYDLDVTGSSVSLKLTTGSFNGTTGGGYTVFII